MFDWINVQPWLFWFLVGGLTLSIIMEIVYYFRIQKIKRVLQTFLGIEFEKGDDE
jgi:hypothetical protein